MQDGVAVWRSGLFPASVGLSFHSLPHLSFREAEVNLHHLFASVLSALLITALFPAGLRADQSAVRLEVPAQAEPGAVLTLRVRVTHEGNNFFHFTDWVSLAANGQEIKRWAFTADSRPEDENFVRELTYTVRGPTVFSARANCNIHGSAGPAETTVRVGIPPGPAAPAASPKPPGASAPVTPGGRRGLGLLVLLLGIANLILVGFQVATGRRWIPVKIMVHRRTGQTLAVLALIHGFLAVLLSN
jgi:desulfoferrodoxin (superoxide reductase-like protein)